MNNNYIVMILSWLLVISWIIGVNTILELKRDIKYYQETSNSQNINYLKENFEKSKNLLFEINPLTEKYPNDQKLEELAKKIYYDCLSYQFFLRAELNPKKESEN
jgi:hypothetical protein